MILLLCSINVFSQKVVSKSFCNKVIETTNAIIVNEKNSIDIFGDKVYTIDCDLPTYITQDLVILSCKMILLEYPDIKIETNWKKSGIRKNDISIIYKLDKDFIVVSYSELDSETKILVFAY